MTRNMTRRRWVLGCGLIVVGLGAIGAGVLWRRRDPWPPRIILAAAPNDWQAGFAADGRSFGIGRMASAGHPFGQDGYDLTTGLLRPDWRPGATDLRVWAHDRRSYLRQITADGPPGEDHGSDLLWHDAASGTIRRQLRLEPEFRRLALGFSAADRSAWAILMASSSSLRAPTLGAVSVLTWNLETGERSDRPLGGSCDQLLAVTSAGSHAATLDFKRGGIQIWNIATDQPEGSLIPVDGNALMLAGTFHQPLATLAPDGRTLAISGTDGLVEFWDLMTGHRIKLVWVHPPGDWSDSFQFSADGRLLAIEGSRWEASALPAWCFDLVNRVAPALLHPATEVTILDVDSGQILGRVPGGSQPQFAPDGRTLVTRQIDGNFAVRDLPHPDLRRN